MVETKTVFDGQIYNPGDSLPDLGSWVCTKVDKNGNGEYNIRNYEGLSADVSKLPKYENLGTGSSAFCSDTGDFYKYEKSTKTWYKIKYSGSGTDDGYADLINEGYVNLVTEL